VGDPSFRKAGSRVGIGTSRSKVNLSDKATFDIDVREGATTVQVDAEYQYTWFLSEESQNDTVYSRFESVFANLRAELDLAPEGFNAQTEAAEQQAPTSENTKSPEGSEPPIEPALDPTPAESDADVNTHPDSTPPDSTPPDSSSEVETPPAESPLVPDPNPVFQSLDVPHRPGFRAMSLIAASLIAVLCAVVEISHLHDHSRSSNTPKPTPAVTTATPKPLPPPEIHHWALAPLPKVDLNPSGTVAQPPARPEDIIRWLEKWAATERTRDAKSQASFYADDVRPYRALEQATRDAVYQDKQDAIQKRQGLWTFKIEHISIQKRTAAEASVLLNKIVMTQTNSVRVSEQRISSFLTLKRTQDGWQITGERDLH